MSVNLLMERSTTSGFHTRDVDSEVRKTVINLISRHRTVTVSAFEGAQARHGLAGFSVYFPYQHTTSRLFRFILGCFVSTAGGLQLSNQETLEIKRQNTLRILSISPWLNPALDVSGGNEELKLEICRLGTVLN